MDLEKIRTTVIVAVCSDDYLLDRLVLKGGNALALIHGVGFRTSLDIDFSMEDDFEDLEKAEKHLLTALQNNFNLIGLVLFDSEFYAKPKNTENDWWGGYCLDFKLIEKVKYEKLGANIDQIRRESLTIDSKGQSSRKFSIDISKFEFVAAKQESEIDGYVCYVYTPHMIAAEKLRAICQQMPEYEFVKAKKRRARDFYDLFAIVEETDVDFTSPEFHEILEKVFNAKKVPLELLAKISSVQVREYHQNDWVSVRDTITNSSKDFSFYYEQICSQIENLKSFWVK